LLIFVAPFHSQNRLCLYKPYRGCAFDSIHMFRIGKHMRYIL
jgi:hypothetical protein